MGTEMAAQAAIHEPRDVIIDERNDYDLYANPDLPDPQRTDANKPEEVEDRTINDSEDRNQTGTTARPAKSRTVNLKLNRPILLFLLKYTQSLFRPERHRCLRHTCSTTYTLRHDASGRPADDRELSPGYYDTEIAVYEAAHSWSGC
jgi:hypothetical protein